MMTGANPATLRAARRMLQRRGSDAGRLSAQIAAAEAVNADEDLNGVLRRPELPPHARLGYQRRRTAEALTYTIRRHPRLGFGGSVKRVALKIVADIGDDGYHVRDHLPRRKGMGVDFNRSRAACSEVHLMPEQKTIKIHGESHELLRTLARQIGISMASLVRALAYAKPEEYQRFENRRLERRLKGGGE